MGVLKQIWIYEILGGMLLICHNATIIGWFVEHGLEYITFYVKNI